MREIIASSAARVWSGVWVFDSEALAASLSAGMTYSFSLSTDLWTVLKFRRASSWGRRRSGWSCGAVSPVPVTASRHSYQDEVALRVELYGG